MYRTPPLRGAWQHPPYFHNGFAADLDAVVDLDDTRVNIGFGVARDRLRLWNGCEIRRRDVTARVGRTVYIGRAHDQPEVIHADPS